MRKRVRYYHVNSAYRALSFINEGLDKKYGAKAVKKKNLPVKTAAFLESLIRQSHQK